MRITPFSFYKQSIFDPRIRQVRRICQIRRIRQAHCVMKTMMKKNPFKEINENLKELRDKEPSLVPESMTAKDFATPDNAVITTSSTLTDEEILQEATKTENDEAEEIEDDDEELVAPSTRDIEIFIGNIEKIFSIC